jgi:hypothetical protein
MTTRREKFWANAARGYPKAQHSVKEQIESNEQHVNAGGQILVTLGGPYTSPTTCSFQGGQTVRYRGKINCYVSNGTVESDSRSKTGNTLKVHYLGAMSRFDGPCHTETSFYGKEAESVLQEAEFAWKVYGTLVRAGGLPVVEYSLKNYVSVRCRQWSDKNGHYHRHSGPALTDFSEYNEVEYKDTGVIHMWFSRGYMHRASSAHDPCCGDYTMRRSTCLRWRHYGVRCYGY